MGHPKYVVEEGDILFKGRSLPNLPPDERARLGVFLAFQYPSAVPGVSVANFLRAALAARQKGRTDGDGKEPPGAAIKDFR